MQADEHKNYIEYVQGWDEEIPHIECFVNVGLCSHLTIKWWNHEKAPLLDCLGMFLDRVAQHKLKTW